MSCGREKTSKGSVPPIFVSTWSFASNRALFLLTSSVAACRHLTSQFRRGLGNQHLPFPPVLDEGLFSRLFAFALVCLTRRIRIDFRGWGFFSFGVLPSGRRPSSALSACTARVPRSCGVPLYPAPHHQHPLPFPAPPRDQELSVTS